MPLRVPSLVVLSSAKLGLVNLYFYTWTCYGVKVLQASTVIVLWGRLYVRDPLKYVCFS